MDRKIPHILFMASWYPVTERPTHGIFIQRHAMALALYVHVSVVYVYASDNPDLEPSVTRLSNTCTEYRMAYQRSYSFLKPFVHYWRARNTYKTLFRLIQNNQPISVSAIQVNVIFPVALFLSLARSVFRVPYTIAEHWSGYLPEDGNYKGVLKKWITRKAVRHTEKIFYVSEPQRKAMVDHGLHGDYELLFNVVDTAIFKPGHKQDKPLLIHISSLVEREKNISGTFDVLLKLQQKGYIFETLIVGGEGQELEQAKQLAEKIGLKTIEFTGNLAPQILAGYLQKAHALLLFSHFEGMPVVALEALACGVPVLATKVGHLPFLIEPDMGILTEKGDTQGQLRTLEAFLKGKVQIDASKLSDQIERNASYKAVGQKLYIHYLRDIRKTEI